VQVLGHRTRPLLDFYHVMMLLTWTQTLAFIAAAYLVVNALFAVGYLVTGGIANSHGTFLDAFFFSVQTMGTIGYGAMYPQTFAANWLVVIESIVSITLTALATGLVFAKFSRPTARVVFTREAVISPHNGTPSLMFRVGNERRNRIVDARIHVTLLRGETLKEGSRFYRQLDLKLSRDHSLSLSRSWSIFHVIDETSPLFGATPESLVEADAEVQVLVVGLDDTSMQIVQASHRYFAEQVIFGARHIDILNEDEDGNVTLDLTKFHDTTPSGATDDFPYPL
jgi:inward rectifier potassium channel